MSAEGPRAGPPTDEAPQELSADDLTSVPQAPIARASAPSKPNVPAPRASAPRPLPRATPPPPPTNANTNANTNAGSSAHANAEAAPQMIRGPRAATLVGIGREPRVDETERLVAGPPSPLETQRRLVEPVNAPAVTMEPVIAEAVAETIAEAVGRPSMPNPDSANTVAHPPIAPPKPADVVVDAPKVMVDAPGAMRVIPEELKETSISLRRVQLQQEAGGSGEHATVIDPTRRARGRAIVAIVVGACGVLLLTGVIVAWARGRHGKTSDETTATTSSTTSAKPKATTSGTAKEPTEDTTASTTTSPTSTSANTNGTSTVAIKPTSVAKGFGRLTVDAAPGKPAPAGAQIFIEGKSYGALGDPLVVPCGYRWILAGKADAKGHLSTRLSKSVSVFVQCGASSDTHFKLTLK